MSFRRHHRGLPSGRWFRAGLLGAMFWASLAAAPALAADDARAKELYQNGVVLFEEGRYEDAVTAWKAAYELSGRPALLFNLASAYERLGQWKQAWDVLNQYRAFARAEEREKLDRRIRNLRERIDAQQPEASPQAAAPPATEPPPPEQPVVLEARRVEPEPTERLSTRAATGDRTLNWVLIGSGATVGAGFATVAAVTYADSRTWIDQGDRATYEATRPLNNASVVLAGVGVAVAITGALLPPAKPRVNTTRAATPPVGIAPRGIGIAPSAEGVQIGATWVLR